MTATPDDSQGQPEGVIESGAMAPDSPSYESVRRHYLFAGLSDEDFDQLAHSMSMVSLQKGDVLFHRADPAERFFYVDSGQIELSLIAPTGEKKILEVVGPARTFAEAVAFMRETRYPVTAEALSDAELCQISNTEYVDTIRSNPDACIRLLCDVSRHLHARVRDIERLTITNARSRLSSYLLDHIVESSHDEATVRLELPRHVIASRLSVQPETLSRLFRQLSDEGLIAIEDRVIFIRSIARLRPYD